MCKEFPNDEKIFKVEYLQQKGETHLLDSQQSWNIVCLRCAQCRKTYATFQNIEEDQKIESPKVSKVLFAW